MDELKKLLEKNQQSLEALEKRMRRIEKHMAWGTTFGIIKAVVIIAPLIFGIIYFTPIIKTYWSNMESVLRGLNISSLSNTLSQGVPENSMKIIPANFTDYLCNPQLRDKLVKETCIK